MPLPSFGRRRRLTKPPRRHMPRLESVSLVDSQWESLESLLMYAPGLQRILLSTPVRDISGLAKFANLEDLLITEYCEGSLDLADLPLLKKFWLDVTPRLHIEPGGGEQLVELRLGRSTRPWAVWIPTLPKLKSLQLHYPRSLPEELPPQLKRLELAGGRRWSEVEPVFEGGSQLEILKLAEMHGMVDLTSFGNLRTLRSLFLEDCPDLRSLEGPDLHPDTEIHFIGNTPELPV